MNKIILSLLATLLISCGGEEADSNKPKAIAGSQSFQAKSTSELARKVNFTCLESDCPDSYALVLGQKSEDKFYRCTGFFLAPNLLATSATCLGQSVSSCSNSVVVKDINGGIANCKGIVTSTYLKESTTDNYYKKDFAVIELDRDLEVTPVEISQDRINNRSSYSYWKVEKEFSNDANTTPDDKIFLNKRRYCKVTRKNVRLPLSDNPNSLVATFKNCPVRPGHEGAALLDYDNKVVGLVWGKMNKTNDYDVFMGYNSGRSLMLANPMSCIVIDNPQLFPDHVVTDTQRQECQKGNSANEQDYFDNLTSIFSPKTNLDEVTKVIVAKTDNYYNKSFYKVSYDACFSWGQSFRASVCSFRPYLSRSYEILSSKLNSCYATDKVRIRFSYFGSKRGMNVYDNKGKLVTRIQVPECSKK